MRIVPTVILLILCSCSSQKGSEDQVKRDTIIFEGTPNNTYRQIVGDWGLRTVDDKLMTFLVENSTYKVKASAGNLDLKLKLLPRTKNITIIPHEDRLNEFTLTTMTLNPDSVREKAIIYFAIDTTYNKPVFIRRDYLNNLYYSHIDNYLKWDGLGEEQLTIKQNVD